MGLCWKSFKMGLGLGLSGKPLPLAKKDPIAYLYNGVKMPAFPEEYAAERPYAVLIPSDGISMFGGYYGFVFSKSPITFFQKDGAPVWTLPSDSRLAYTSGEDDSEYCDDPANDVTNLPASRLIWSNYDILNEDGTLYLAASEPVPVYE